MRKVTILTTILLLSFAAGSAFAGGGEKAKQCSNDVQACIAKFTAWAETGGWNGVYAKGLFSGEKVVVSEVVPGSPGHKAGIQVGDVLLAMNGQALASMTKAQYKTAKKDMKPGSKVVYKLVRNGEKSKVKVAMTNVPQELVAKKLGYHVMKAHSSEKVATASL